MINTDEKIKRDIVDQLLWNNQIDASTITAAVDHGIVSLGGETFSYAAKDTALKIAWGISGVKDVRNNITVRHLDVTPSDDEIKVSVRESLVWNKNIDASKINFDVNDGKIELEGNVDAYWKIDYIEKMISDIHGVMSIENKISVVPGKNIVDESIAENVAGQIDRSLLIEAKDIIIKVKDGKVFLSGKVPTFTARRSAYKIASNSSKIKSVKNNLIVDKNLLNQIDASSQ
jgi:osmotically-inducible protein OsmY